MILTILGSRLVLALNDRLTSSSDLCRWSTLRLSLHPTIPIARKLTIRFVFLSRGEGRGWSTKILSFEELAIGIGIESDARIDGDRRFDRG